jgi:hypothetical protein
MPSAYDPLQPAQRPGSGPNDAPLYRVLVDKRFRHHYKQLVERVGLQQAQQLWDFLASTPGGKSAIASTTVLKGKAGAAKGPGWSRTVHYEVTGSARVDYQFHNSYKTKANGDEHCVVAILTISFGSH